MIKEFSESAVADKAIEILRHDFTAWKGTGYGKTQQVRRDLVRGLVSHYVLGVVISNTAAQRNCRNDALPVPALSPGSRFCRVRSVGYRTAGYLLCRGTGPTAFEGGLGRLGQAVSLAAQLLRAFVRSKDHGRVRRGAEDRDALAGVGRALPLAGPERIARPLSPVPDPVVAGMSLGYLQQFQVVVLQNFNMPIAANSETSRNLRAYVEQGGGLLLGHDTAWFMESIFPEVAVRAIPANKVEWGRHVAETNLVVAEPHPCLGAAPKGREFPTEFRDHMIFKAGPAGRIVIRNTFGDPVIVVADVGKGRVVFSGCYYGYSKPLSGLEESVFQSMLTLARPTRRPVAVARCAKREWACCYGFWQ